MPKRAEGRGTEARRFKAAMLRRVHRKQTDNAEMIGRFNKHKEEVVKPLVARAKERADRNWRDPGKRLKNFREREAMREQGKLPGKPISDKRKFLLKRNHEFRKMQFSGIIPRKVKVRGKMKNLARADRAPFYQMITKAMKKGTF